MSGIYRETGDELFEALDTPVDGERCAEPTQGDIVADLNSIYKTYDLQTIVRFYGQRHWEKETSHEGILLGELRLETVAAHSFHVASGVMLLASHFPWLDTTRAIELALLHDQPEIWTGDKDPVGASGQGLDTHAFNNHKRKQKEQDELIAIEQLTAKVRPSRRGAYKALFEEFLVGESDEARFVKAVDKLQALVFVRLKKRGDITPEHAAFTIRYSKLGAWNFPLLRGHFKATLSDLLNDVSKVQRENFEKFCFLTKEVLDRYAAA